MTINKEMSGRSPSGPPRDDRRDDPSSGSGDAGPWGPEDDSGVVLTGPGRAPSGSGPAAIRDDRPTRPLWVDDFADGSESVVRAPWDLPEDEAHLHDDDASWWTELPDEPILASADDDASSGRGVLSSIRSGVGAGRSSAKASLSRTRAIEALKIAGQYDNPKKTADETDARAMAEYLHEMGELEELIADIEAAGSKVVLKDVRKRVRTDRSDTRKEMNKAYNAKLSVSLGKLAWHLTGGKIARKIKEVYRELPLAGQAAVSGIGSAAVTLAAVELFNYTTGHLESVVDQTLPHIGRPAEAIAAISLGLVGAVAGPATTWAKQLTGEDLVEFMYKAGSSLGRVVGKGRRLVARPERSEEERLRDMKESARRRREEMADDDEIWTSTE